MPRHILAFNKFFKRQGQRTETGRPNKKPEDRKYLTTGSREGVIIECPLNGQYHDRCDVILTSQMAVSNNLITVTVIQNIAIVLKK